MLVISSEHLQQQPQTVLPEILQFIDYPTSATMPTTASTYTGHTTGTPDDRAGSIKTKERNRNRDKGGKASYSALDWLNNITYIESLTSKHFPSKYYVHSPCVTLPYHHSPRILTHYISIIQ